MDTFDFLQKKNQLLSKKKEVVNAINIEYTALVKQYTDENSPVELFKVYELKKNGNARRGFKRFIPYQFEIETRAYRDVAFIVAWGWWLNKENVPERWDCQTVYGIGNPPILELSENQTALQHPESKDNEHNN